MTNTEQRSDNDPASFKFVFSEHIHPNLGRIVNELADVDVVAIELVGGIDEVRSDLHGLINTLSMEEASTYKSQRARIELEYVAGTPQNEFFVALATSFAESGKKLELIDITSDSTEAGLFRDALEYEQILTFKTHAAPLSAVRSALNHMLKLEAKADASREKIVTSQLHDLGQQYPGASIGVMAGATHTAPFHDIQSVYPSRRVFVDGDQVSRTGRTETMRYAPSIAAARAIRFKPDKPLTTRQLDRALLEVTLFNMDIPDASEIADKTPANVLQQETVIALTALRTKIGITQKV